ncbi:MAG: glycosyltransferase [Pyrinomonadaceae bacterium]
MQTVKVLHLIPTLSSGGAERQLVNLVRSTSKDIVEHVVCVINDADFFAGQIRDAGFRVIELQIETKHPFISAAWAFRKVVADVKPDVVHSWLYDANVSARLTALTLSGIPIVTSLQLADYEPDGIKEAGWNPKKVGILKVIDRITAKLSGTYFIACSDFVKRSYQRNFGIKDSNIETIYNAVDIDTLASYEGFNEKLRKEFDLPEDAFVFLNVGRLDPQKSQKFILYAFASAQDTIENSYLLIAGVGHLERELKSLAKDLHIDDMVSFLGRRNDVGALLAFADVFVFPSLFEGLPVALAEAMFKSLPCIASNIEVFKEVIEDRKTGLMVDPASVNEMSKAMIELYTNSNLRKSLGDAAYVTASSKFNAAVTARQWEDLYQRISGGVNG